MSASSVSGVGTGSAIGKSKNSPNVTLGVERLIGPRVILTGSFTLSASTGNVVFPTALPGVATDYQIYTASVAHSYASSVTVNGFVLNGTSGNTVNFMVVKVTNATVTAVN